MVEIQRDSLWHPASFSLTINLIKRITPKSGEQTEKVEEGSGANVDRKDGRERSNGEMVAREILPTLSMQFQPNRPLVGEGRVRDDDKWLLEDARLLLASLHFSLCLDTVEEISASISCKYQQIRFLCLLAFIEGVCTKLGR